MSADVATTAVCASGRRRRAPSPSSFTRRPPWVSATSRARLPRRSDSPSGFVAECLRRPGEASQVEEDDAGRRRDPGRHVSISRQQLLGGLHAEGVDGLTQVPLGKPGGEPRKGPGEPGPRHQQLGVGIGVNGTPIWSQPRRGLRIDIQGESSRTTRCLRELHDPDRQVPVVDVPDQAHARGELSPHRPATGGPRAPARRGRKPCTGAARWLRPDRWPHVSRDTVGRPAGLGWPCSS